MRHLIAGITLLLLVACAPRVYQISDLETVVGAHSTIAVIKPKIEYKNERPDKRKWDRVPSRAVIADGFQSGLVNWIGDQRERGKIDIVAVDTATVNQAMRNIDYTDYPELARKLGVDAILVSRIDYDTRIDHWPGMLVWSLADDGTRSRIYLNLYTSSDGMIWSYEQFGEGSGRKRSYDQMIRDLLRDADKSIPYAAKYTHSEVVWA